MKLFWISFLLLLFATAANTKIVFYSKRDGNSEIYTMNDDGSQLRRITNNPAADFFPVWAPDGQTLAFKRNSMRDGQQQRSDVILMNVDGSNERVLTNDNEARSFPGPAFFTPDGRELAITTWDLKARTFRLYFMDVARGVTRPLRGVAYITGADISPDGRFIAFEKTPGFAKNIHIVAPDGRGEKPLLPPNADPDVLLIRSYPRWAPDSQRLMFVESLYDIIVNEGEADTDLIISTSNLFIYHLAAKRTERLPLPKGFRPGAFCWINNNEIFLSADATGLITKERGNYDIYRYHLTSGTLTQLTTHPAQDLFPRWVAGTLEVSANEKQTTQWGKVKAD